MCHSRHNALDILNLSNLGSFPFSSSRMGSSNSMSLTFSLLEPPANFRKSQRYYLSLTTPGYPVRGQTESRTAPGEFVNGIILPSIVPPDAQVLIRLHREETRFRLAKYHEVQIRADRIRLVVLSHFSLRFEDAPGVVIHVEALPRDPCACTYFRAQTQFASTPQCWPFVSAACSTVVSRRRDDGTWAPVLQTGELPNQKACNTPLLYEPGKADAVTLRVEAFTVPIFGPRRPKCIAVMICSLHFLLNAQEWSRLVLYCPRRQCDADVDDYRNENENNLIAGMIHTQTSKGSAPDLIASIELGVVLFGRTGTRPETLNLNATRKWEESMPPLPLLSNSYVPEYLRSLHPRGKWKSDSDGRTLSSLSHSMRASMDFRELISSSSTLLSFENAAEQTEDSDSGRELPNAFPLSIEYD